MTKFHLCSDLHLEFADVELPGGDVLIMAGDILVAGSLRRADNAGQQKALAEVFRRFLNEELKKYQEVVYICGNHEHYFNSFYDTFPRIKKELPTNVHFLEKEHCKIDNVHIFGGTMWTNMNGGNPISIETIRNGMNDFRVIKHDPSILESRPGGAQYYTSKFTPTFAREQYYETLGELTDFLDERQDETVLVVTHHAPSEQSISGRYRGDFHLNGGYYSNLEDYIIAHPQIKAWVHGHVHVFNDYQIEQCRVMSNPRGYPREGTGWAGVMEFEL